MDTPNIHDINNMSPEELEAFKLEASKAIVKRFLALVLFKVSMTIALRLLAKKLEKR